MNNIFEGKLVRLRAVEPSDVEHYWRWSTDTDAQLAEGGGMGFPGTRAEIQAWAERESKHDGSGDYYFFIIETLAGEAVGRINSHTCEPRHGTFMFAIAVWPDYRHKGYAREAILLLMRYYFDERRYQKCSSLVYSFNEPSIRLHEGLGFVREGRLRRMIYARGEYHDEIRYGMTVEEFRELHTMWSEILNKS